MSTTDGKIEVSADALCQLLTALQGPGHYIRELQVLANSSLPMPNPISTLTLEYNEWAEDPKECKGDQVD